MVGRTVEAPIGSEPAGAALKDTWTLSDVDVVWYSEIADREPTVYAAIENGGPACMSEKLSRAAALAITTEGETFGCGAA